MCQATSEHPEALLSDTVFVTLQINAGSNIRTSTVISDLRASLSPQPPYNAVPVQVPTSQAKCRKCG